MTRSEYVQWCKDRALEYLDQGELANAVTSMMSDMRKRDDTRYTEVLDHLGMLTIIQNDFAGARRWIVGFN